MTSMIDARTAFDDSKANGAAKWPDKFSRKSGGEIILPSISPSFKINPEMSIFTIGSCFARHIEIHLKDRGYSVPAFEHKFPAEELWAGTRMSSGFLNKYTPHSMLNEVEFAFGNTNGEEYLINVDGKYLDNQCHTNQSVSLDRALERRQEIRDLYRNSIQNSEVVIITLGLIETWWDSENQVYLNEVPAFNLVKKQPDRFKFEVMSVGDTINCVDSLITTIQRNALVKQNILLTVSPVPLNRTFTSQDVIVANTYSKSVLRVAAQHALNKFARVDYYPSFESISNSSVDATWEDDMLHVTQGAVSANVKRMCEAYEAFA